MMTLVKKYNLVFGVFCGNCRNLSRSCISAFYPKNRRKTEKFSHGKKCVCVTLVYQVFFKETDHKRNNEITDRRLIFILSVLIKLLSACDSLRQATTSQDFCDTQQCFTVYALSIKMCFATTPHATHFWPEDIVTWSRKLSCGPSSA